MEQNAAVRSGVPAVALLACLAVVGAVLIMAGGVPPGLTPWVSLVLLAIIAGGTITSVASFRRREVGQRDAQARLAAERDRLCATLQAIPEAVYICDDQGVRWSNPAGFEMLGIRTLDDLPRGRKLGAQLAMRRPDTAVPVPPEELPTSRALAGETVKEEVLVTPVGSAADVHVRVAAAPVAEPDGSRSAVVMCSDLTAGLDDVAFIASLSDTLSTSLDYDETVETIARMALPRLGDFCSVIVLERDGSQRLAGCAHVDPAVTPAFKRIAEQVLNTPYAREESRFMRAVRERRTVMMEVDPEQAEAGFPPGYEEFGPALRLRSYLGVPLVSRGEVIGVVNIGMSTSGRTHTARHARLGEEVAARAATALEHAWLYRHARDLNRVKDEFLATLSHELRTPVMAVLGWTQMLKTGVVDPDRIPAALETIERNAFTQKRLIEDLLDVSRIVTGRLRLDLRPVDPVAVVAEAAATVQPAADAREIRMHVLSDPSAGLVLADPQRLQQAIWNLLANAVKFTPRRGQVHVHLLRVGDHVEIVVSDTGDGIAPDLLPHVFDRFRQGDSSSTRAHEGLGLGLAIVRHIVELHGGEVEAKSAGPGEGATFRIVLPVPAGQAARAEPSTRPPARVSTAPPVPHVGHVADLAGVRVLLVEDNADAREMVAYLLRSIGARVTLAASARDALASLDAEVPDVVVSDIQMADQDGVSLMASIRARPPERGGRVPAAALTSRARAEDRQRSEQAGYQAHLAKPVDISELVATVAGLARRQPV